MFNVIQDSQVKCIFNLENIYKGNKHFRKYLGQITLLALGPLTNLAIAVRLVPKIKSYPSKIVILGGTIYGMKYFE